MRFIAFISHKQAFRTKQDRYIIRYQMEDCKSVTLGVDREVHT